MAFATATSGTRASFPVLLLKLVRFSHTLFALPYAVAGLVLGARAVGGWSAGRSAGWKQALLVLAAMVSARTAAMTFNRLVDRRLDATNPRTRGRPSVTGAVSPAAMRATVLVACATFVAASAGLNPLCGWLSFVALAVVLGYSLTKRFTLLCHWVLGCGLGLSPIGAYLAVRGAFDAAWPGLALLGVAVMTWTAGFDILYACQDVEHDRREGLHSAPARLGVARALIWARVSHACVPPALAAAGWQLGLGPIWFTGVAVVAALLVAEHRLVRADDLSKVDRAFFQLNVFISFIVMSASLLDVWMEGARVP